MDISFSYIYFRNYYNEYLIYQISRINLQNQVYYSNQIPIIFEFMKYPNQVNSNNLYLVMNINLLHIIYFILI
jgi:hypothetical protein